MTNSFLGGPRYGRSIGLTGIYGAIMAASFFLSYDVRFDFLVPSPYQHQRLHYICLVVVLKLVTLVAARQFGSMITYFGITDLLRVLMAMTFSTLILLMAHLGSPRLFVLPRGMLLIDYMLSIGGICAARLGARLYRERISPREKSGSRTMMQNIAIVGAGDAGASLVSEFINRPRQGFRPVAFYDDDPGKFGKSIHGVPVLGPPEEIPKYQEIEELAKLVIAMPSASARRIREIVQLGVTAGLKVETLPSLEELASGKVRISRIRPVEVQDLLGRDPVNLDSASIRNLVEDRVVLVTGAGGSIGSELCRQIAGLSPKSLLMLDRSEGSIFAIEEELSELGLGGIGVPLVANILDLERMEPIFSRFNPAVVFHAAAHKHVFMMERQPVEAISNNVLGTSQLMKLAIKHRVGTFVFISTDKAINPTSVMGATKRLAEIQIQSAQPNGGTKFISVRFGNVLGSSGSVIPIFKRQIANGGPVRVTHPDVTRYFMTIPEAVGLVLQSAVLGRGGEIFVLDMGQPVRIIDLARQMIVLSGLRPGEDIEITFTGLKPGEKLFEELQHRNEKYQPTEHPRIMRFVSEPTFDVLRMVELERQLHRLEPNQLKEILKAMVPEYAPHLD